MSEHTTTAQPHERTQSERILREAVQYVLDDDPLMTVHSRRVLERALRGLKREEE